MKNALITIEEKNRIIAYANSKKRHGVHAFEFESKTKDMTLLIDIGTFIKKIENASIDQLNKWFRIKENGIHIREMNFANGQIATKQFCAGGKLIPRAKRMGDWLQGEKEKAQSASNGLHNTRKNHWFDYSFKTLNGERIRIEVKHAGAWFEPNREGR